MCHFSWFYLLEGIQTSKGQADIGLEGRSIPVHVCRPHRSSPGKELHLDAVSGADISKSLFQGFLKQGRLRVQGGPVHLRRSKNQLRLRFLFQLFLIRAWHASASPRELLKIHMLKRHTSPTELERVGGAEMLLKTFQVSLTCILG